MLGKLIRYDGRLQMKFFGGLYAIMGVVALISAILKGAAEYFDHLVVVRYAYQMAWFFLPDHSSSAGAWKYYLCDLCLSEKSVKG